MALYFQFIQKNLTISCSTMCSKAEVAPLQAFFDSSHGEKPSHAYHKFTNELDHLTASSWVDDNFDRATYLGEPSIARRTSFLNISLPVKTIKRDPTLADKPDHLPFASAAFAELHRRRASSARIPAPRPISPPPPLPVQQSATRPTSPAPPPLPPKPESLHFPNGEQIHLSSTNGSFTDTLFDTTLSLHWPHSSHFTNPEPSVTTIFSKALKSKILKHMTLPVRPVPADQQRNQIRRVRRATKPMRSEETAISYLDPYSSDDNNDDQSSRFEGEEGDIPVTHPGAIGGEHEGDDSDDVEADASDEAESVIVHYAEIATFQRPVMVQCASSSTYSAIHAATKSTTELRMNGSDPDLCLELGRKPAPLESGGEERLSPEEEYYREAEERLERRLAEDTAQEKRFLRLEDDDDDDAERDGAVHWSDVVYDDNIVYDDSIVDQHLALQPDEGADSIVAVAGVADDGGRDEESIRDERPSSAMSELDLLVRESLVIAHRSELLSPIPLDMVDLPGVERKTRKVSFTLAEGPLKRVNSLGPSTPYPFKMLGEGGSGKDVEEEASGLEPKRMGGEGVTCDG